ncbi:MAG: DNA polymerase Y family protein [Proteobacteria bacterium]|nr:DNA polymerase Y family protein [Pseudomonadota bacterium]
MGGARRLAAVNEAGEAAGLWRGKKLADSLALVPELRTADHEPEADASALLGLADGCVRFSPAVAPDGPDGLFLDVTGGAAPWGGEAAWLHDLLTRLSRAGAPARAAVADTAGAAWALARFGQADRIRIRPGAQADALRPLPVAALRLPPAAQAGLPRLGLTTVGQVSTLPRAQLAKRFGASTLLRLDQALGTADEALPFRRPPTPWFERLAFFDPLSAPEDLRRAVGDLLHALCERLAAEGQGARRFETVFHRADGCSFPVRIGTGLPARDPDRLLKLFAPKLEFVDPGFGIDAVTLTADRLEPLGERQTRLDQETDVQDALAALVDQLGARLGESRVWRAAPQESHVPERAVTRRPASAPLSGFGLPSGPGWDPERPRPMRLLPRPEPVEAMAAVPDNPPLVFTWRGRRRRVRRAEGPERIAEEWWLDAAAVPAVNRVRDYYAVEDGEGERFWLFRDGLYRAGETPRWFLHGLFG